MLVPPAGNDQTWATIERKADSQHLKPMPLYAILTSTPNGPRVEDALKHQYPGAYYKIAADQFVVSADGLTTKQVAEKLGVAATQGLNNTVVFAISNYWGYHNKDLWEWLAARSST